MTTVVVRNVSDRMRGFLASSLIEVGVGTYVGSKINRAVRERIWNVLLDWFRHEKDASVVMIWDDPSMPGGINATVLGTAPVAFHDVDGLLLSRRQSPSLDFKPIKPIGP